ncbi:hypothetical protein N9L89_07280 [Gammaproteobacteria bacterium]|nr:hypothetical protein [Gammaproteobacteria bacterium]
MKKTLLLAAALACSGAAGQQDKVWSCIMLTQALTDSDGTGFFRTMSVPIRVSLLEGHGERMKDCEEDERFVVCRGSNRNISNPYENALIINKDKQTISLHSNGFGDYGSVEAGTCKRTS